MERKNAIDIMKFILALMVVAIHINPFGEYGYLRFPLTRVAVPLFFMVSSFFFFRKIHNKKRNTVKNFVLRNIKLYFSWMVLLMPVTLRLQHYFTDGILIGIKKVIISILFASTFPGSWYISALLIDVLIINLLSKYLKDYTLLFFGFVLYCSCCLMSNYGALLSTEGILINIRNMYPGVFFNSFPVGFFWVALGKVFAEKESLCKKTAANGMFLVMGLILLIGEQILIKRLDCEYKNDCYFMLVPVCYVLFSIVLSLEIKVKKGELLQVISTVTYCLHISLGLVFREILEMLDIDCSNSFLGPLGLYVTVTFCCIICAIFLYTMSKKKHLYWLNNFF